MLKKLIRLVVLLVVLIIGGVIAAFIYIDTIAKTAVERGSTYALGVDTKLKSAKVRVFDGQFVMAGLNVSNPSGYKTDHFLALGKGNVALTLSSLTKDIIELPHLNLNEVDLNLEKKDGKANYQVILDHLKGSESSTPPPAETKGKRYIIKKLTIRKTTVHVDALPIGGSITKLDLPLDDIVLKNLGADNGQGISLSDLSGIILKSIVSSIIAKGGGLIPADILGDLSSQLAGLKDIGKLVDLKSIDVNNLGSAAGDIGKKATDAVNKAAGSLGGLLNKDDKNKK